MDWQSAKDLLLQGLLAIVIAYVTFLLKDLVNSVTQLNIQIAKILAHIHGHERRISALEFRKPEFPDEEIS